MSFDSLSPELQEKVKACKTIEELQELPKEESCELNAEDLEGIAGGYCTTFRCGRLLDHLPKEPVAEDDIYNQLDNRRIARGVIGGVL